MNYVSTSRGCEAMDQKGGKPVAETARSSSEKQNCEPQRVGEVVQAPFRQELIAALAESSAVSPVIGG